MNHLLQLTRWTNCIICFHFHTFFVHECFRKFFHRSKDSSNPFLSFFYDGELLILLSWKRQPSFKHSVRVVVMVTTIRSFPPIAVVMETTVIVFRIVVIVTTFSHFSNRRRNRTQQVCALIVVSLVRCGVIRFNFGKIRKIPVLSQCELESSLDAWIFDIPSW